MRMARTILDQGLEEIRRNISLLVSQVDVALEQALSILTTKDLVVCNRIISSDQNIDKLRTDIEQQTFRLLTMQQPLGGHDLRFLTAVLPIVGDLERMGDGAAGIAKMVKQIVALRPQSQENVQAEQIPSQQENVQKIEKSQRTGSMPYSAASPALTEESLLQGLLALGSETRRVLQGTMHALTDHDVQSASYNLEEDDVVDVRYHLVRHDLMAMLSGMNAQKALEKDSLVMQRVTYYFWIAHKLERMADHCTNVCERIVFIEGEE
jgi:phosphate transport system protein